jgi:hypothetical protein
MKDESTYLTHAIEAIDAIADYTADGQKAFFSDAKTQDVVIRNIEIAGQTVEGISEDTRALEPEVPWRQIAGMRDKYRWLALAPPRPGEDVQPKELGVSLTTADTDATHTELRSRGVDVDEQVSRMGDPVPPMFWFRDPEGHSLMVVEQR